MKVTLSIQNLAFELVTMLWTPIFVAVFVAIVIYALLPRNKATFDAAARAPLREE